MNTAFLDSLNLAWKIHHVERGFAHRDILKTYEHERKGVANALIDFDNYYAKVYAHKLSASRDCQTAAPNSEFAKAYRDSRGFVSGYGIRYDGNILNWSPEHPAKSRQFQTTRGKLAPGSLFIIADVTRVVDANVVHLEQAVPLNGSYRIFIFAGHPSTSSTALRDLSNNLKKEDSFYTSHLRPDIETISWHEKHNPHSHYFTICTIFAAKRKDIEISEHVPGCLSKYRHHVYADDRAQPDGTLGQDAPAHARAGFENLVTGGGGGGVVVVRPDGYVGAVIRLVEGTGTAEALNGYFLAILNGSHGPRQYCSRSLVEEQVGSGKIVHMQEHEAKLCLVTSES